MSTELYFIYDSHCPWSYAATKLVENITTALPQVQLHLMHSAYFDGDNKVSRETIKTVEELSTVKFNKSYIDSLDVYRDSTLAANLLTWVQNKSQKDALTLLKSIQKAHFEQANPILSAEDVTPLIEELKLSPPAKSLKSAMLTKDAEFVHHDINEMQEIMGTNAIPALLLAHDEQLILLNHNLYLEQPEKIIEAVKSELDRV